MKTMVQRLRTLTRAILGREPLIGLDLRCANVRLGSTYGGWHIIPDLDSRSVVYSFGVGEDASFDLALIERFGVTVHAFDPTPKSIAWVERQALPPAFVLHPCGLADADGTVRFNPPADPTHVSHTILDRPGTQAHAISVPVKRLATIQRELAHERIDLLKMDIEGAEYAVISDLVTSAIRPRQLLVEFHHRFPGVGARRTREAVAALRAIGYRLFAISPTNEEFSFLHG